MKKKAKPSKKPAPKPEKKPKAKKAATPADEKAKKKAAIARAVWKETEAHRTTIGKLAALVDTWDEYDKKAEELKDECGGLKGQISEDRAEIRRIVREDDEASKLKGLERDIDKRELKLAGKQEERSGAREAMKCAMADIRKIIKDGPGLFEEKGADPEPTGAGKAAVKDPSPPSPPAPSARANAAPPPAPSANGTHPPLKSQAAPAASDELHKALAAVTIRELLGPDLELGVQALEQRGIKNLDDAATRGMTEIRRIVAPAPAATILERMKQVREQMGATASV